MDDINNKISEMLSNPQSLEQIMSLASTLGLGGNSSNGAESPVEQHATEETEKQSNNNNGFDLSMLQGDTMNTIMSVLPLLGEFNKDDDSKRLLNALRPFLGEERRAKLDEASKILSMLKLLPVVKNLNILG